MYKLVYINCGSETEAKALAQGLVSQRLAACVSIMPGITSVYHWQGKVEQAQEVQLQAKTRSDKLSALTEYVDQAHSYDVPEIIAVDISEGNAPYLEWIKLETQQESS